MTFCCFAACWNACSFFASSIWSNCREANLLLETCYLANSVQLTRFASVMFSASPVRKSTTKAGNQFGLRTMSANVDFGENKTPTMRPRGEMAACGSAAGTGVVAIEDSFPQVCRFFCCGFYIRNGGKVSQNGIAR